MLVKSKEEAKEKFASVHPELHITNVFDYDKEHYVIEALHIKDKVEMDPYYAVNKTNGEVTGFAPAGNLMKWFSVLEREAAEQNSEEDQQERVMEFLSQELYGK